MSNRLTVILRLVLLTSWLILIVPNEASIHAQQAIPTSATVYITLVWERSRETDTIDGRSVGAGVEAGLQLPTYSDFIWDNGTYTPEANRHAVPSGYRWASWWDKHAVDIRHLKGKFNFPLGLDPATTEAVLFDPFYSTDTIPINDNLYVYLNGARKANEGTSYGAPNGGMGGSSPIANETDGWYIPGGIKLSGFTAGLNVIDIVVEDYVRWGGLGYLMLRIGPRTGAVPMPFLDLPINYSSSTFFQAAQGNVGGLGPGRVNSWFDHSYPTYCNPPNAHGYDPTGECIRPNNNLTRWDGQVISFTPTSLARIGESWYEGHNGIDFQHRPNLTDEPVLASAPGTVLNTTTNSLVTDCREGTGKVRSCGNYFGNHVWIDHHNGYATLYGHLRTVAVTADAVLTSSQTLGVMGDTGNSTGSHLHFGLYYDLNGDGQWTSDEAVDPYGWFGRGADPWNAPSQYMWAYGLGSQGSATRSGTTITSPSGSAVVTVPPDAVASPVTVELWDTPPVAEPSAQLRSLGHSSTLRVLDWAGTTSANNVMALGQGFTRPISVSLTYSETDTLHLDPSQLRLYQWNVDETSWTVLTTTLNMAQRQATAQTTTAGSFDLQAPLLCPADVQEPNDSYYSATPTAVDGLASTYVFDVAADEDWFKLQAATGRIYDISTQRLRAGVEIVLQVFDMNGLSRLASATGAGGSAPRIVWQAPNTGTYYIRVAPAPGSALGCDATYALKMQQWQQVYLPLLQHCYGAGFFGSNSVLSGRD